MQQKPGMKMKWKWRWCWCWCCLWKTKRVALPSRAGASPAGGDGFGPMGETRRQVLFLRHEK